MLSSSDFIYFKLHNIIFLEKIGLINTENRFIEHKHYDINKLHGAK